MKKLIYAYAAKPLALIPLVLVICACFMIGTCTYVGVIKMLSEIQ